jgi:hypothetical protein
MIDKPFQVSRAISGRADGAEDPRPHAWRWTDDASYSGLTGGRWSGLEKVSVAHHHDESTFSERRFTLGI